MTNVHSALQDFNDEGHTCLIWGDFNLIQDLALDREGGAMKTIWKRSCAVIDRLKDSFGLMDVFRVRNKTTTIFTWRRYNPYVQSRLDFWLTTESLHNAVVENDIVPCVLSDYVTFHFHSKKQRIVPSHWKLNNSLIC